MNKVMLCGRLTRDPELRYAGEKAMASYTLAVNRRIKKDDQQSVDYLPCVVFGKSAEWAEKYLRKGMKIIVSGRVQTGSYINKEGKKVYTTDIFVEEQEFAESKSGGGNSGGDTGGGNSSQIGDGFMNIPDGIEDAGLPFN